VVVVVVSLAAMVTASLAGGDASTTRIGPMLTGGWAGILESAGLLFFAFAGYARIATLGEEVIDPVRTIPRAIAVALGITLVVYAAVASAALAAVGPAALAASATPLATAVEAGSLGWLSPGVRLGGTVASLGVLLSLLVGLSRTTFAMAARGDLPTWLDRVHPQHQVPHHAELAVGVLVAVVVAVADLRGAIGFSSFAVLTYYAVANAAAFTLPHRRRRDRAVPVAGAIGCVVLALTLPSASVAGGAAVLVIGLAVRQVPAINARGAGPRRRQARRGAADRGHRLGGRRPPRW
jgi:APA family basic amino acid/polyamine antiporter